MACSTLDLMLQAVNRRIYQLETETCLIHAQVLAMSTLPGHCDRDLDILVMKNDILTVVHSLYGSYFERLSGAYCSPCPFRRFMLLHFWTISQIPVVQKTEEIACRQDALSELTGASLYEHEPTAESVMRSVALFFPYKWAFTELVRDHTNFPRLMKIVVNPTPETHRERLRQVYKFLQKFQADNFLMLTIAEIILSFFVGGSMRQSKMVDPIPNFQFVENCRCLLAGGATMFELPTDTLNTLSELAWVPGEFKGLSHCQPVRGIVPEPRFEWDDVSLLPFLRHVVLELRKVTTQVSVSMMTFVLWQAIEWLMALLSTGRRLVGADESSPFFVAVVADAKLFELPTIVDILESFTTVDLTSPKLTFVITRLKIAQQFITSRLLSVPPFILLPFLSRDIEDLELISEEPIRMPCFEVNAFPLYQPSIVPATVVCTGHQTDVVTVWQYDGRCASRVAGDPMFLNAPTHKGNLFYVTEAVAIEHELIHVDASPYLDAMEEIAVVSNLSIILRRTLPVGKERLRTSRIDALLTLFRQEWKAVTKDGERPAVFEIVADVQDALKAKGLLEQGSQVDGRIDATTLQAIKDIIKFDDKEFFLDRKVKNFICSPGR
jgi:hypothetical protein